MGDPSVQVSVVIGAYQPTEVIFDCLDAIFNQPGIEHEQVILAISTDATRLDHLRSTYPHLMILTADGNTNIPTLRGAAIAEAIGEVIVVLDPFSIVAEDWMEKLKKAHAAQPNHIIGGPVNLARAEQRNLWEWALYINEYGMFMEPMPMGEMEILPGCNIAYKRTMLFDGATPKYNPFWKTFVNWDIHAPLWLANDVVVSLDKPVPLADYFRTRFDHGRCFGAMRVANQGWGVRLFRAATTPIVPWVLLWRWGKRYMRKGRYRSKFFQTLPLQILLFHNWALGELIGYLLGGGDACERLVY